MNLYFHVFLFFTIIHFIFAFCYLIIGKKLLVNKIIVLFKNILILYFVPGLGKPDLRE